MPQAVQNLSKDAPFTRLDLVSCRNLLIYLGAELQHQPALLLYYRLNPGGCLVRGASETIGGFTDLFSVQDPKWKLYRRRESAAAPWSSWPWRILPGKNKPEEAPPLQASAGAWMSELFPGN